MSFAKPNTNPDSRHIQVWWEYDKNIFDIFGKGNQNLVVCVCVYVCVFVTTYILHMYTYCIYIYILHIYIYRYMWFHTCVTTHDVLGFWWHITHICMHTRIFFQMFRVCVFNVAVYTHICTFDNFFRFVMFLFAIHKLHRYTYYIYFYM